MLLKLVQQVAEQLKKAESHLIRISMDAYKHLIICLHDELAAFQKKTKKIVHFFPHPFLLSHNLITHNIICCLLTQGFGDAMEACTPGGFWEFLVARQGGAVGRRLLSGCAAGRARWASSLSRKSHSSRRNFH